MDQDVESFISHWRNLFMTFLSPRSLLSSFPLMPYDVQKQIKYEKIPERQVEYFLRYLVECGEPGILQAFMDALRSSEKQSWIADVLEGNLDHKLEQCVGYMEDLPAIKRLFVLIKKDLNVIDFDLFIQFFSHHLENYEKEELQRVFANRGNLAAGTAFFSVIVRKSPSWLKEFHKEIKEQNYNHNIHGNLAAAFREYFSIYETITGMDGRNNKLLKLQCSVDPEQTFQNNFDQQSTTKLWDCMEMINIRAEGLVTTSSMESTKQLKLRNNQLKLAEQALQGNNSLIVTNGDGRTYVALHICMEHLKQNPTSKVVFMVPKVALIKQHHDIFNRYMGNGALCIVTEPTINVQPQITFMTPQILANLLKKDCGLIHKLGLLIFDECHHVMKDHPYNNIMQVYHNAVKPLPQIVGMTASPWMSGAISILAATRNIMALMSNLSATIAPLEVGSKDDMNEKMFEIRCLEWKATQFHEFIIKVMKKVEGNLKEEFTKYEDDIDTSLDVKHGTHGYGAWCVQLREASCLLENKDLGGRLITYAHYLQEYNNSLLIDYHVSSSQALQHVRNELTSNKTTIEDDFKSLHNKFASQALDQTSPMFEELNKQLKIEFTKSPDSQCIIFVRTKSIAKALGDCLHGDNLQPKQVTGVAGGRGRVKGSRMYLLAYKGSQLIEQEEIYTTQVKCWYVALEEIRNMNPNVLEQEIKEIQRCLKVERDFETSAQGHVEQTNTTTIWTLFCKQCKTYVTTSDQFQHINNHFYVVVDPSFPERANIDVQHSDNKEKKVEKVFCKNCRSIPVTSFTSTRFDWGGRMRHKQQPISVLKIASFVLEKDGNTITVKKWKQSPFKVQKEFL
ncbi:antiviral innate immune response receptor RIG-I-like [Ciona intestinalis]